MPERPAHADAYGAAFPEAVQQRLNRVRTLVRETVPDAEEDLSYGIPAFRLGGWAFLFVAGYARHLGVYPLPTDAGVHEAALAPYRSGKATMQVPHTAPLPEPLLRAVAQLQAEAARHRAPRLRPRVRPAA